MANRAVRIAAPILRRFQASPDRHQISFVRKTSEEIRAALTTAGFEPCVVRYWANEPVRRLEMTASLAAKKDRRNNRDAIERRRQAKRLEQKRAQKAQKKIHRVGQKIGQVMNRMLFRGGARKQ